MPTKISNLSSTIFLFGLGARIVPTRPDVRHADGVADGARLTRALLLHQGEVLSFRDYHKWILRPILGLGRDRYVFAVYHPCWLVTTPGVLISGHIGVGVIFSGRKGGYL